MLKNQFNIVVCIMLFFLLSPILVIIGLMISWKYGRPILFKQQRSGLKGEPFLFYKFRTMNNKKDEKGNLLPDAKRLTSFGVFLRKTSLDELPSLWNVIKGDMSLVGPRPLLMDYLPLYNNFQKRRHEVKPGITGWAQVNGRNAISWEEKFKLDVWYVEHQSFWLDLKILCLTLYKVVKREGISGKGEATMSKFEGSKEL